MTKYIVTGGTPLHGSVQLRGAKNAGFKIIIASLFADEPSTICNLSLISEIEYARQVITALGGKVTTLADPHCLSIDPHGLKSCEIPQSLAGKSRSTTMYVGPLLYRFGKAILPLPGGDTAIAKRPIDRHIDGLEALGAKVNFANGTFIVEAPSGLQGTKYRFRKNTHTGTETLIMCAAFARGETVLENCAADPEIDDLIDMLSSMGATVSRLAPRTIKIVGRQKFIGARHTIINDRHEAVTFGCMALATRGWVKIVGARPEILAAFLEKLRETDAQVDILPNAIKIAYQGPLKATQVTTAPYPGFMTDWQPLWTALMTQAQGESTVHEAIFENRFGFIADLEKFGAKFELFNPPVANPDSFYNFNLEDDKPTNYHAVKVFGPAKLEGRPVEVNDLRRGATLLMAGLTAQGISTVIDPNDQIKRGYEDIIGRLTALGAKITKEVDEGL